MQIIAGLSEIIDRFDAVYCDLWGAVHDGLAPYPGVLDCLAALKDRGTPLVLISNAPRPNPQVREHLASMGVSADLYTAVITSGDATVRAVNAGSDALHAGLGAGYYHIGPSRSATLMAAIEKQPVAFENAGFILNSGLVDDETETVEDYRALLEKALARDLPMVCANPDFEVMRGDDVVPCAGALALAYEEMGGRVAWHGKPHTDVFNLASETIGNPPKERLLMVGDTHRTDIAGANAYGIASLWLGGGLHAERLALKPGGRLDESEARAICAEAPAKPTYAAAYLAW